MWGSARSLCVPPATTGSAEDAEEAELRLSVGHVTIRDVVGWRDSTGSTASAPLTPINAKTNVYDAIVSMSKQGRASIVVVDDNNDIVGTFYDRDYVLHLMHGAYPPDNLTVAEVMEKNVTFAQMSTPLQPAVAVMTTTQPFMPVVRVKGTGGSSKGTAAPASAPAPAPASTAAPTTPDLERPSDAVTVSPATGAPSESTTDASGSAAAAEPAVAVATTSVTARQPASSLSTIVTVRDVLAYLVYLCEEEGKHTEELFRTGSASDSSSDDSDAEDDDDTVVLPKQITVTEVLEWQRTTKHNIILNTRKSDEITTADAANEMSDKDIACVVVVDDKDKLVGLFTAKDFLRTIVVPRLDATKELVSRHMSTLAICADPTYSVLDCARLMLTQNFRHLPVVDQETKQCIGVITGLDLLHFLVPKPTSSPKGRRIHDYFQLLSGRKRAASKDKGSAAESAASAPAPAPSSDK